MDDRAREMTTTAERPVRADAATRGPDEDTRALLRLGDDFQGAHLDVRPRPPQFRDAGADRPTHGNAFGALQLTLRRLRSILSRRRPD